MPLLATLMSSVFCGALPMASRNLGHRGVVVFSILSLTIAFISSAFIWVDLYIGGAPVWLDLFGPWFEVGTVTVSWIFYYDLLTAHMLFTVTSVSLAVHIYATVYMRGDPHLSLFMSYLSLFTFFMLVYVCGDNLLVMLVGWEGINHQCLNGFFNILNGGENCIELLAASTPQLNAGITGGKGSLTPLGTSKLRGVARLGVSGFFKEHCSLFHQIVAGFMLGDGWFERRNQGVRMGISQTVKFGDQIQLYKWLLYGLGYTTNSDIGLPLTRKKSQPYYQFRTLTCDSLNSLDAIWYDLKLKANNQRKNPLSGFSLAPEPIPTALSGELVRGERGRTKVLALAYLEEHMTPLVLAIWCMGDGSGMICGGFKLCTHNFTYEENVQLSNLLFERFGIVSTINHDKPHLNHIYVWKRSVPKLYVLVKPYLAASSLYKFRFLIGIAKSNSLDTNSLM